MVASLLCCLFGVKLCPTHVLFSSSPLCQISLYFTSQTPLTNQSKDIYDDMARRHIPNCHGIISSFNGVQIIYGAWKSYFFSDNTDEFYFIPNRLMKLESTRIYHTVKKLIYSYTVFYFCFVSMSLSFDWYKLQIIIVLSFFNFLPFIIHILYHLAPL